MQLKLFYILTYFILINGNICLGQPQKGFSGINIDQKYKALNKFLKNNTVYVNCDTFSDKVLSQYPLYSINDTKIIKELEKLTGHISNGKSKYLYIGQNLEISNGQFQMYLIAKYTYEKRIYETNGQKYYDNGLLSISIYAINNTTAKVTSILPLYGYNYIDDFAVEYGTYITGSEKGYRAINFFDIDFLNIDLNKNKYHLSYDGYVISK